MHPTEFDIGEARCFGRNVFMGYLNRESETKEVMAADEGWLNLGHLGYLDPDDYLVVHGRRENYVTLRSGGWRSWAWTERSVESDARPSPSVHPMSMSRHDIG